MFQPFLVVAPASLKNNLENLLGGMVHIQYTSDLHIDEFPKGTPFATFVTPVAPILIIAGDVCSVQNPLYWHFLAWCSRNWHIVILITGNHEYSCKSGKPLDIEACDSLIGEIAHKLGNVFFLQNGASYVIPGTRIRFIGATLWSDIDPAIWSDVGTHKGDFKNIYVSDSRGFRLNTPSDSVARHAYHKMCLTSAIAPMADKETLIVVTHHMPSMRLLEAHFQGEKYCTCYASNDDDLFAPNVTAWICGHSHRATALRAYKGGPLLLMNARGYNKPHELGRTEDKYNPSATFRC